MNNEQRDELQKLIRMHEDGVLTTDEFNRAKTTIIGNSITTETSTTLANTVSGDGIPNVKSQYGVAKSLSQLQTFIGWVGVAVGGFVAIFGIDSGGYGPLIGIVIGVILAIGGLIIVGLAQLTKAVVDTADYSREILYLLHQQSKR